MKIGEKVITDITIKAAGLLRHYMGDINRVLERDGNIKIGMPIDLKQEKGRIKVRVALGFVTDRIDDQAESSVDEQQLDLPLGMKTRKCPTRDGDDISEKFCNTTCTLRKQIIVPEAAEEEPLGSFTQYRSCSAWSDDDTHAHVATLLDWEPAAPEAAPKVYVVKNKRRTGNAEKTR